MASCGEMLSVSFPALDGELLHYIEGILEHPDDFDTSDDLFDAIGPMLQEMDDAKSEDDVRLICDQMMGLLKDDGGGGEESNGHRVLSAPVHLGTLAESMTEMEKETTSIWMVKKDKESQVDKKKLEKADAKLKQKQEKKAEKELYVPKVDLASLLNTASASQMSNRKMERMETSGTNKTKDIRIENFDVAFGDKTLLTCADILLSFGRRYGLVGRNGMGKSTLLRMMASRQLWIPSYISILHVEQEVVGDDTLATESVLECDEVRTALLREEKEITAQLNESNRSDSRLSSRLAEIYHEMQTIEADKAPAKAAMILNGLGFTTRMQNMKTREFSGGWRMRLALARALFSKPDLLLLDGKFNFHMPQSMT